MDNIEQLQEAIKVFIEQQLLSHYTFDTWKDTFVADRSNAKKDALLKQWDFLGECFSIKSVIADVEASPDMWAPCLMLECVLMLNDTAIPLRLILVKDKVQLVQVLDRLSVSKHYGEKVDLANEFEKHVVLMHHLKSKSN